MQSNRCPQQKVKPTGCVGVKLVQVAICSPVQCEAKLWQNLHCHIAPTDGQSTYMSFLNLSSAAGIPGLLRAS